MLARRERSTHFCSSAVHDETGGQRPSSRKVAAAHSFAASERVADAMMRAAYQSTSRPSAASSAAGMTSSRHGFVPKASWATRMPSTAPGTAMALAPTAFLSSTTAGQGKRSEEMPLPERG